MGYSISLHVNYTTLKPIDSHLSTSVITHTKLLLILLRTFFQMIFYVLCIYIFVHLHHFLSNVCFVFFFFNFYFLLSCLEVDFTTITNCSTKLVT